ncbi:MAG: hypothetical protein QOJ03_1963 [Frankiaceae bacterium]|jgi:hypothetical protein|nr:hypothetical protein [Frankiaceae bacterium]
MRAFTLAAGLAVAAAAAVPVVAFGPASAALASDLCQTVQTSGTIPGTHTVQRCVNYNQANFCQTEVLGFEPWAEVKATACVPAIVSQSIG